MTGVFDAIAQRIANLRETIPPHVRLIAVSKQVSVEAMRAAYAAGVRDFGESRIQEAEEKQHQLQDLSGITWHLIGHLQSNKVAKALQLFDWIHSVDSLKLARRLNTLASDRPTPPQICLQVKFAEDPNKYGWDAPQLLADLPELDQLHHLNIVGLMTIPPLGLSEAEILALFSKAKEFSSQIDTTAFQTVRMKELSMGMSGDYALAVQAGATMVRLGRVLFGDRPPQPSQG